MSATVNIIGTNIGHSLMAGLVVVRHTPCMKDDTAPKHEADQDAPEQDVRIADLKRQVDGRDEIIRLLNEALSQALDELHLQQAA